MRWMDVIAHHDIMTCRLRVVALRVRPPTLVEQPGGAVGRAGQAAAAL